ncbi:acetoacetate decarboxylase family protein [Thermomonospora catenispora]|uniref:acetoacetate decarboxylase family protein n=1 Tax=Thermomonospora catenispora TaxID=2493090 RepID=UPI00111E649F|nr:acetoacetate decarboxylase family protein [Thermomonospora catenispora]TNY34562.1 acetoacetate decarboxylase [Thermomonospora catenispora]
MGAHLIQGERVATPVRVRKAAVASAMFAVPAATAQSIIDYSGLRVVRPLPGRAVCALAFARYLEGDLGPYHEFAVTFLVRDPETGGAGAFVHWLPVDQAFTLEAGRSIWGFPKLMAEIPAETTARGTRCAVKVDGRSAVAMSVRSGPPLPAVRTAPSLVAFSCLDGVTRRIPWTVEPGGIRARPGGAVVSPGDHPVAEELRRLGLHRAVSLSSASASRVRMLFHEGVPVTP